MESWRIDDNHKNEEGWKSWAGRDATDGTPAPHDRLENAEEDEKDGGYEEEEEEIVDPFSTTPGSITDIVSMARAKDPSLRFMPNSQYVQKNFYAADGRIAKLSMGGGAGQEQMMQALQAEYMKYKQQGGTMPFEQFAKLSNILNQRNNCELFYPRPNEPLGLFFYVKLGIRLGRALNYGAISAMLLEKIAILDNSLAF